MRSTLKQLHRFVFPIFLICGGSCVAAQQPQLVFDSPLRVYAGEGLELDSIQTAIDWFNKEVDQECLILYPESWPYEEVPGGVIKIERGTCSGTLAGCVGYKASGPVYGDIRISKGNESNSLLIAHEIAHILTNANNKGHTAVKGVMANPPNAWALPPNYLVNVAYACETKEMAPAIAKSLSTKSRAD